MNDLQNLSRTRLKSLRAKRDVTLRELEEKTGIHYTTLAKLEAGKRSMTLEQAVALADYFNITLDYLLFRETKDLENYFGVSIKEIEKIVDSKNFKSKMHEEVVEKIKELNDDDLLMVNSLLNRLGT